MSLINEALKRAQQIQETGGTAAGPALRPAQASVYPEHRTGLWLPALIGVVFAISVLLLWQWFHAGPAVRVRAKTPTEQPSLAVATASPTVPVQSTQQVTSPVLAATTVPTIPAPAAATAASNIVVAATATDETATTNLVAADPPKPPPVTYKLQSLFYRRKGASAVINGKTVFEGDRVGDARVIAIASDAVAIVAGGQTNYLELP